MKKFFLTLFLILLVPFSANAALQQFANNAVANLAGDISNVATTITIDDATGWPTADGSDWFMGTLVQADGDMEIFKCTTRAGTTLTVVRAQESTTGLTCTASPVTIVSCRLTAETIDEFVTLDGPQTLTEKQLTTPHINEAVDCDATSTELNTAADGISDPPLAGDATAGRVLRAINVLIADGTASGINCTVTDLWNGDAISIVEDITTGATKGDFSLAANGGTLTIEASGLTGNCVGVLMADVTKSKSTLGATEPIYALSIMQTNDIIIQLWGGGDTAAKNMTTYLSATEYVQVKILYVTDE